MARRAGSCAAAPSGRGRSPSSAARRPRCSRPDCCAALAGAGNSRRPCRGRRRYRRGRHARVKAPVSRFSSTVRWPKQWRPSITWIRPRRTTSAGIEPIDALAVRTDRALGHVAALGAQQVGDRLQASWSCRRRWRRAARRCRLRHRQRHALQHQDDVVVDDLDVVDAREAAARVCPVMAGLSVPSRSSSIRRTWTAASHSPARQARHAAVISFPSRSRAG